MSLSLTHPLQRSASLLLPSLHLALKPVAVCASRVQTDSLQRVTVNGRTNSRVNSSLNSMN